MGQISRTLIATSNPVDLCKGNALFPKVGTARAGLSVTESTTDLINANPDVGLFKGNFKVSVQVIFGVCGPAYGISFYVQGETRTDINGFGNTVALTVSDDYAVAGFFVGLAIRVTIAIGVDRFDGLRFHNDGWPWNWWVERVWAPLWDLKVDIKFDVIELLQYAIKYILKNERLAEKLEKVGNIAPSLQSSWGLIDDARGDLSGNRIVRLNPTFDIPINMVPFIPQLRAFATALEKAASSLEFGPQIGIVIPVDLQIKSVTIDNNKFDKILPPNSGNDSYLIQRGLTYRETTAPKTLGVEIEHKPGFDLKVGAFAKISCAKLFEVGTSFGFPLLQLLGIRPTAGPYYNTLSNTVGKTVITASNGIPSGLPRNADAYVRSTAPANPTAREVIFEPEGILVS